MRARFGSCASLVVACALLIPGLAGCAGNPVTVIETAVAGMRAAVDDAQDVAAQTAVANVTVSIRSVLATQPEFGEQAIADALMASGATAVQTRAEGDAVVFGAAVAGGCVFGEVSSIESLSVEYGGAYPDGSCLDPQ